NSSFFHCTAISQGLQGIPRFSLHEINPRPEALGPQSAGLYGLQRGLSYLSSPEQPPLTVGNCREWEPGSHRAGQPKPALTIIDISAHRCSPAPRFFFHAFIV
ncbi:hypothetical protein HispidOSU_019178, partial [Sigmodon hispidus]